MSPKVADKELTQGLAMLHHILIFFEKMSWSAGALLMVASFMLVTCIGVCLIRLTVNPRSLKSHHDVAAVVFANIGVLYSVLLGFTVVNVQQRFDKIKENTQIEASYLVELFRDAEVFAEKDKIAIRDSLIEYSKSVIYEEWPKMAKGELHTTASTHLSKVWNAYYAVNTTSHKQDQWYSVSINKLNLLMNARLSRLLGSHESLGVEMWAMLILGAAAVASFICFFGLESLFSHLLMAAILAGFTGFLLFLVYSLDTAFQGDLSISPRAMQNFLESFK